MDFWIFSIIIQKVLITKRKISGNKDKPFLSIVIQYTKFESIVESDWIFSIIIQKVLFTKRKTSGNKNESFPSIVILKVTIHKV